MPLYDLLVSAETENVKAIKLDPSTFNFRVTFECEGCGSKSEKPQVFSAADGMQEVPGGRGEAHFLAKTKCCGREYNVSVVSTAEGVYDCENNAAGKPQRVATMEVRGGAKPVALEPGSGWTVVGPSQTFEDQDLNEDLAEFDEEASESLSVMGFKASFEASKGDAGGKGKK